MKLTELIKKIEEITEIAIKQKIKPEIYLETDRSITRITIKLEWEDKK